MNTLEQQLASSPNKPVSPPIPRPQPTKRHVEPSKPWPRSDPKPTPKP